MKNAYRILVGKPEGKRQFWRSGGYRRIICKWILKKWGGRMRAGLIWLRSGSSGGLLHCDEPPGYIKGWEFFKYLKDCRKLILVVLMFPSEHVL
jgi:hypothetical protein